MGLFSRVKPYSQESYPMQPVYPRDCHLLLCGESFHELLSEEGYTWFVRGFHLCLVCRMALDDDGRLADPQPELEHHGYRSGMLDELASIVERILRKVLELLTAQESERRRDVIGKARQVVEMQGPSSPTRRGCRAGRKTARPKARESRRSRRTGQSSKIDQRSERARGT